MTNPWDNGHWMDRAPDMLRDIEGPEGEPLSTHFDRRWLWRLEGFLAIRGTTEIHRQMLSDLSQYLHETCVHVWRDLGDLTPEPSRQCLWCNTVETVAPTGWEEAS